MNSRSVRVFAPAKLNLFLHVLGRRPDGYHELETVFCLLDHGDWLDLELRNEGVIERAAPLPGVDESQDLCLRAARLLAAESGARAGVCVRLDKRLPMGGGLGGGSSDAAAVLLGLNRLWRLGWTRERLQELGLRLGADVPVFVFGQSAFATGVGEVMQPVRLAPAWYLVLVPSVHVSTVMVFADKELTRDSKSLRMTDFLDRVLASASGTEPERSVTPASLMRETRNDLQPVVCRAFPQVARCLDWLAAYGDARMTGSGACVFAVFSHEHEAREILARVPADITGFVARGLLRHPQADWAEDSGS